MPLMDEFEAQGNWLFRRRSFLPLLGVPLIVLAFQHVSYPWGSRTYDMVWDMLCFLVSLVGLSMRVYTAGYAPRRTSGRNTRKGQVADSLNTSGIYSAVRHPLYLGNFLTALGLAMFFRVWWMTLLYTLLFWLYYERIMLAEEAFLRSKFGEEYLNWASRTPAFLPRFSNWRSPNLRFSWRTAIKREYQTLFVIVTTFFVFDTVADTIVERHLDVEPLWSVLFVISLLFFVVIRVVRKKTKLLTVEGR